MKIQRSLNYWNFKNIISHAQNSCTVLCLSCLFPLSPLFLLAPIFPIYQCHAFSVWPCFLFSLPFLPFYLSFLFYLCSLSNPLSLSSVFPLPLFAFTSLLLSLLSHLYLFLSSSSFFSILICLSLWNPFPVSVVISIIPLSPPSSSFLSILLYLSFWNPLFFSVATGDTYLETDALHGCLPTAQCPLPSDCTERKKHILCTGDQHYIP